MGRRRVPCGAVALVAAMAVQGGAGQQPSPQSPASQLLQAPRDRGLNVAPVYEGWQRNADGTNQLYFGYMNRNWKEELDIPIGPANSFAPGPADRGQPTYFMPRRHKQVFSVVVPKDFAGPLVWTLSIRGAAERVTASLAPAQEISASKDPSTGNTPPRITLASSRTITLPQPATLSAVVSDDGLPKPGVPEAPAQEAGTERSMAEGLRVTWEKYRGPGQVTFTNPRTIVEGGKATTAATFSDPGLYVIHATASDGSVPTTPEGDAIPGSACCWTTGSVTITVKPGATPGSAGEGRR